MNYSMDQDLIAGWLRTPTGWAARIRSARGHYVIHVCRHSHPTRGAARRCAFDYIDAYDRSQP